MNSHFNGSSLYSSFIFDKIRVMETIKIILKSILCIILLLGFILLLHGILVLLSWLSIQIGFITTLAILVGIIYLVATSSKR